MKVTVVHFINDIMSMKPDEHEVRNRLGFSKRHMYSRWWDINPTKGPNASMTFLEVQ